MHEDISAIWRSACRSYEGHLSFGIIPLPHLVGGIIHWIYTGHSDFCVVLDYDPNHLRETLNPVIIEQEHILGWDKAIKGFIFVGPGLIILPCTTKWTTRPRHWLKVHSASERIPVHSLLLSPQAYEGKQEIAALHDLVVG